MGSVTVIRNNRLLISRQRNIIFITDAMCTVYFITGKLNPVVPTGGVISSVLDSVTYT